MHKPKRVLFYRDFRGYTGGHQKVADYFNHLRKSKGFAPSIAFSRETIWDGSNPWFPEFSTTTTSFSPIFYDYLFLAGMDWVAYLDLPPENRDIKQPIVNFIQHVRHGDATQRLYSFLQNKAVRICVSQEVSDAIMATGKVNGPVYTIPNGHDIPEMAPSKKLWDFLIVGGKQPELARKVNHQLSTKSSSICLLDHYVPRKELYEKMAQSRIAVLLPNVTEGFYLPALEAMKYCDITIVPDCVGNRGFCLPEINCLMPTFDADNIVAKCLDAKSLIDSELVLNRYKHEREKTLSNHSLERERALFLEIMANLDQIW